MGAQLAKTSSLKKAVFQPSSAVMEAINSRFPPNTDILHPTLERYRVLAPLFQAKKVYLNAVVSQRLDGAGEGEEGVEGEFTKKTPSTTTTSTTTSKTTDQHHHHQQTSGTNSSKFAFNESNVDTAVHFANGTLPVEMKGDAMRPAIPDGSIVDVKLAFWIPNLFSGDVVALRNPTKENEVLLRRVVSVEGDELINPENPNQTYTVPADSFWVKADNTGTDSGDFGPVHATHIIGRALKFADGGPVANSYTSQDIDAALPYYTKKDILEAITERENMLKDKRRNDFQSGKPNTFVIKKKKK